MSFDQIALASSAAMRHRLSMMEVVMEPIASALGVKKPTESKKHNKGKSKEEKEQELLAKLNSIYGDVPVVSG